MRFVTVALVLALQQAPLSEVIEVRRHNVEVIVTDHEGNHVRGLRLSDFELLEDGVRQEITNFAEYDDRAAAPSTTTTTATTSAPVSPPPTRRLVFFIDDMSMNPRSRELLTEQATEMLERTMRAGDEGAVVRPPDGAKPIDLTFTSDREELRKALGKAIAQNTTRTNVAFAAEYDRFQVDAKSSSSRKETLLIARRHAERVRRRVQQRLAILRAVVATMAPLEGRKVLIVATESLPVQPGREFFDIDVSQLQITFAPLDAPALTIGEQIETDLVDVTPAIEDIARTASSNGITIYALRPELDLRISPDLKMSAEGGIPTRVVNRATTNSDTTVDLLTKLTGGTWTLGAASMNEVLKTVAADVQSYYSLAYRGRSATYDKAHRVTVRVRNHPEYTVRARTQVARKSPKRDMNDRVAAALFTEDMPNELGIAIEASEPQPVKGQRGRYAVTVDVAVPLGNLTYLQTSNAQRGRFSIHYAISNKGADFVNGSDPEQIVDIPLADFARARTKAWTHTIHLLLERGEHRITVGVLDGTSQAVGMSGTAVNVP